MKKGKRKQSNNTRINKRKQTTRHGQPNKKKHKNKVTKHTNETVIKNQKMNKE